MTDDDVKYTLHKRPANVIDFQPRPADATIETDMGTLSVRVDGVEASAAPLIAMAGDDLDPGEPVAIEAGKVSPIAAIVDPIHQTIQLGYLTYAAINDAEPSRLVELAANALRSINRSTEGLTHKQIEAVCVALERGRNELDE